MLSRLSNRFGERRTVRVYNRSRKICWQHQGRASVGETGPFFVGGRLLVWSALWKLLTQVPKERSRLDAWILVTQHFGQACKTWDFFSQHPSNFLKLL